MSVLKKPLPKYLFILEILQEHQPQKQRCDYCTAWFARVGFIQIAFCLFAWVG